MICGLCGGDLPADDGCKKCKNRVRRSYNHETLASFHDPLVRRGIHMLRFRDEYTDGWLEGAANWLEDHMFFDVRPKSVYDEIKKLQRVRSFGKEI